MLRDRIDVRVIALARMAESFDLVPLLGEKKVWLNVILTLERRSWKVLDTGIYETEI